MMVNYFNLTTVLLILSQITKYCQVLGIILLACILPDYPVLFFI